VSTVDTVDMSYVRWEPEAMTGRSLENSFRALEETGKRAPSERRGLDLDRTGIPRSEGRGWEVSQQLSSGIISIASLGHTTVQIPHPLQYL
jgi:hypothetical protein